MKRSLAIFLFSFLATFGFLMAEDDLKPYMEPKEGQERHVIRLEALRELPLGVERKNHRSEFLAQCRLGQRIAPRWLHVSNCR